MLYAHKTGTEVSTTKTSVGTQVINAVECLYDPFREYYKYTKDFTSKQVTQYPLTSISSCEGCRQKESQIELLKKKVEFLQTELDRLYVKFVKKTRSVPLVSLEEIIKKHEEDPDGRKRINTARQERQKEWQEMVKTGRMSKIKYYRLLRGLDQLTFAKKLGMAQSNVSRLERPGYRVSGKTLVKIAKILDVSVEELVEY